MLDLGVHGTMEDLARAKGVHATYVSRVLRPTLLAPEIVEAIVDGRQPAGRQLDNLLAGFSLEWDAQRSSKHSPPNIKEHTPANRSEIRTRAFPAQRVVGEQGCQANRTRVGFGDGLLPGAFSAGWTTSGELEP